MMNRRKKITWGIAAAFFVCVFCFNRVAISCVFESLLKPHVKGAKVSFETISWKGMSFSLGDVSVQSDHIQVDAARCTYHLDLSLFPFSFESVLEIDQPQVVLSAKEKGAFSKKKARSVLPFSVLMYDGVLKIEGETRNPVYFDACLESKGVHLTFGSDEKTKSKCHFLTGGVFDTLEVQADELDCAWFAEYVACFLGKKPAWQTRLGLLSGEVCMTLDKSCQVQQIACDAVLDKALFVHETSGCEVKLGRVHFKQCHAVQDVNIQFPFLSVCGDLKEGEIVFKSKKDGEDLGSIVLDGKIAKDGRGHPTLQARGYWQGKDKHVPFDLNGTGYHLSDGVQHLECDIEAEREGFPNLTVHTALLAQSDNAVQLLAEFSNVSCQVVQVVQTLFSSVDNRVCDIVIDQGVFDGKLLVGLQDMCVTSLECQDLVGKDVVISHEKQRVKLVAQEVGGHFVASKDLIDSSFSSVIKHGTCEFKGYTFQNVDAFFAASEQEILPSYIAATYNGVRGRTEVTGSYSDLAFETEFNATPVQLMQEIGVTIPEHVLPLCEEQMLDVTLCTKESENGWDFTGKVRIGYSDLESDQLAFGFAIDNATMTKGFFRSDKLQARTYQPVLKLEERSWDIQGNVSVDATFNQKEIDVIFGLSDGQILSPYLDIVLVPNDPAPKYALYDIASKEWSVKVPIQSRQAVEKRLGLIFDQFDAVLTTSGKILRFENLKARSSNVIFEGNVLLDFENSNDPTLDIVTHLIEGSVDDVQRFMRSFDDFKTLNLPLKGYVKSGENGLKIASYLEPNGRPLAWSIALDLTDGSSVLSRYLSCSDLSGHMTWDSKAGDLCLSEMKGDIAFMLSRLDKELHFEGKHLRMKRSGEVEFDLRLEKATHDVAALYGTGSRRGRDMQLQFDKERTHLFGAPLNVTCCHLSNLLQVDRLTFATEGSSHAILKQCELLMHLGVLPIDATMIDAAQQRKPDGNFSLEASFDRFKKHFLLECQSHDLVLNDKVKLPINIACEKQDNHIKLTACDIGEFTMQGSAMLSGDAVHIDSFSLKYQDIAAQISDGVYRKDSRLLFVTGSEACFDLAHLNMPHVTGICRLNGDTVFDLSEGWRQVSATGNLLLDIGNFGEANLHVETIAPMQVNYSSGDHLVLSSLHLHFLNEAQSQIWSKIDAETLDMHLQEKSVKASGLRLLVPPEMVHHLVDKNSIPFATCTESGIQVGEFCVPWDNQIDCQLDISASPKHIAFSGGLKDGFYWVKDKAWEVKQCVFSYAEDELNLQFDLMLPHLALQASHCVRFGADIGIESVLKEQGSMEGQQLRIESKWNPDIGFSVSEITGQLIGLDCSLQKSATEKKPDESLLTGYIKFDLPRLRPFLPTPAAKLIKDLELGSGYELSGDLCFSVKRLQDTRFAGHLKGKHFLFLGSDLKTLLSEISITRQHVALNNFKVSDAAGIIQIDRAEFDKEKEWSLKAGNITVQDFRPSLLKKIGKHQKKIKPLVIKEMVFSDLEGNLSDLNTLTGHGEMSFVNSFKKDYSLLDVPIEIIGRIGLDPNLLVPVKGTIKCALSQGKILFTEMKDSFSEGKRSKFYLSTSSPSFITLGGDLNINVKMKQYVLLKFTQPFTLSVQGNLSRPKYSLR